MPYANGQIANTILGAPTYLFIPLDDGWITAASLHFPYRSPDLLGPHYGQIFISFGAGSAAAKAIILAQGSINSSDGVYWTGKQLLEESMHLGFMIRSNGITPFNYAYFVEKYCPLPANDYQPRTDKC